MVGKSVATHAIKVIGLADGLANGRTSGERCGL